MTSDDVTFDYTVADTELGGELSLHVGARSYDAAMRENDPGERNRLFQKASRWYERSADLGNAQAATNLGYVYLYGRIGDADARRAFKWFSRGAELGNEESCYKLGDLYKSGKGCVKDEGKAIDLYHRAWAIAVDTCNPDIPDQAAVLGGIALRLAEWHERSKPSADSLQIAGELYTYAANCLEVAVDSGLEWYGKALENARSGVERLSVSS